MKVGWGATVVEKKTIGESKLSIISKNFKSFALCLIMLGCKKGVSGLPELQTSHDGSAGRTNVRAVEPARVSSTAATT